MPANVPGVAGAVSTLKRFRLVLGLFMLGLVLSGLTAFPLLYELEQLAAARGQATAHAEAAQHALDYWILTVRDGLRATYARYPWVAYGTDWLAFAHLVIAIFFIGPYRDPVRNIWVLKAGLSACVLVVPLALICGELRGIPWGWRLLDCSFGVLGALPLGYCVRLAKRLETGGKKP
ncbi:MAG: hypothetical protein HY291_11645 [Planctomycetes bacterium]|nr:hypothetical protein [Planctomycetota bacterium]